MGKKETSGIQASHQLEEDPLPTMNFTMAAVKKKGTTTSAMAPSRKKDKNTPAVIDPPAPTTTLMDCRTRGNTPAVDNPPQAQLSRLDPTAKAPACLTRSNTPAANDPPAGSSRLPPPTKRKKKKPVMPMESVEEEAQPTLTKGTTKPLKPKPKAAEGGKGVPKNSGQPSQPPSSRAWNPQPKVTGKAAKKQVVESSSEDKANTKVPVTGRAHHAKPPTAEILPLTPLPPSGRHMHLFNVEEQAFQDAEAQELEEDPNALDDEAAEEDPDKLKELGADYNGLDDENDAEEQLLGFGQPRSPFRHYPPSSHVSSEEDDTACKTKRDAKGKGPAKALPSSDESEPDDKLEDELEDDTESLSFIDPKSKTRLVLPLVAFALSPDRVLSSPIGASVQQKGQKRKRVDFDKATLAPGPSRGGTSTDVLEMHKKKKMRKGPNPDTLATIGCHLSTPSPANKKQRCRTHSRNSETGPPKWQLSHWTPHMRNLLTYGKGKYKLRVVREHAYPTNAERTTFGQESFVQATEHAPEQLAASSSKEFDRNKLRVMADTSWGIRGQVKTNAITQIVAGYSLEQPQVLDAVRTAASARKAVAWTKERVVTLLKDSTYLIGPHNNVPDAKYMNKNLFTLIRGSINTFSSDIQVLFTPMPHAMIALAATCIEMALRQWSTGRLIPVQMGAKDEKVYKRHMK